MFKVMIAMQDVATAPNFPEAFALMYREIKKLLDNGTSYQVLETTNFISWLDPGSEEEIVLPFYDARDLAYTLGLIKNEGELQPVTVEV